MKIWLQNEFLIFRRMWKILRSRLITRFVGYAVTGFVSVDTRLLATGAVHGGEIKWFFDGAIKQESEKD